MVYKFSAPIARLEGKIKWSVIYFPHATEECFGSKGNIAVNVTVDGHPFEHTLLGSRNGHYFVYNEFIRRAVGKDIGDEVEVTIERDEKPRVFATPAFVEEALVAAGVLEVFERQPDYLKREQVNAIELAKKPETKQRRIERLIGQLRR